ncbi:MAG: hypothetical protein HUU54_13975 [Ignavibacteriaceae bacterium]|nr:hypothetical protein [Ignavibacteriaceae bacterium]
MSQSVRVSVQGLNKELTVATGSYDQIALGKKDNLELYDLLTKVQNIRLPNVDLDQDFCYPNVMIELGGGKIMTLGGGDGKLVDNDTETPTNPKDAVKIAFGEVKVDRREKLKEARDSQGKTPALKHDIPPTDRDKVKKNNIDTGPSSPQFSLVVWKSSGWQQFAYTFPIATAVVCFLLGFVVTMEARGDDAEAAPLFYLVGILVFLLMFPLKKWGKHEFRLGVDWKKNVLWCWREKKGVIDFEPDANMIEYFGARDTSTSRINYRAFGNPGQPLRYVDKSWSLQMKRTTSEHMFVVKGSKLANKKEARKVTDLANQLWDSQK